jgi:hypothetical protein
LVAQEVFLAFAVLRGDEGFGAGAQRFDGLDGLQACCGNVFKLGGDDIDLLQKAIQLRGVVVGGVDLDVGKLPSGAALRFIGEDGDAMTGAACFKGEHAPELTAAEDSDRRRRRKHHAFGSASSSF